MTLKDFINQAEKIGAGNRVRTKIKDKEIEDAKLQYERGAWYICQNQKNGGSCRNKLGYKYSWIVVDDYEAGKIEYLEPYTKTLADLEEGDLIKWEGDTHKVLGRAGSVVFLSNAIDHDKHNCSIAWMELEKKGVTIIQPEPVEDTIEVTLEQIAEKMGIPTDKLRIKE